MVRESEVGLKFSSRKSINLLKFCIKIGKVVFKGIGNCNCNLAMVIFLIFSARILIVFRKLGSNLK
jgi:hypothetical protein